MTQDVLSMVTGLVGTKGIRDKALLLIGFAGAFRRSELVSLTVADIQNAQQGLIVHLTRSKTDQMVAHDVVATGSDRAQLSSMAFKAREATGDDSLQVIADRGYYSGLELKACDDAGIEAYVPKPMTSSAKADGRFDRDDFVYDVASNEYRCPAGSRAIWRFAGVERNMKINRYWSSDCPRCPIKAQCTPSDYRRISRWEHAP